MSVSYDASNRKHVDLAKRSAERADRERAQFVTGLMSTTPGRAWMLELLEGCHIFTSSFNGNALQTAFTEGERNVGLKLLNAIMAACPDSYVLMMREKNVKEITEDGRRKQSDASNGGDTVARGSDGRPLVSPGDA